MENIAKMEMLALREAAIEKHRHGERLTLEETALAIWKPGIEAKPMSIMGVQKIEKRALAKLREELKKYGITSLADILPEPRLHPEDFAMSSKRED